jgi:hypothetical protein
MAISLEQLEGYLLQDDLRYVIDDERILLSFSMDDYVGPVDGRKQLLIGIRVADEGRYAEICAPRLYDARRAVDVGRLAELLLFLAYGQRHVRFGLDRSDGEVQATIAFNPVDGTVTFDAFIGALRWLPGFIDFWHPVVDRAIQTGDLPGLDRIGGQPEIARMIALAGGIERFVEIAAGNRGGEAAVEEAADAAGEDTGEGTAGPKPRRRGWRSLVTALFFA